MKLNEEQVPRVRQWIDEGLSAAAIQTKLQEELGLKMTYAEVRFLLGDLQLRPKDVPKAATPILGAGAPPATAGGGAGKPAGGPVPGRSGSASGPVPGSEAGPTGGLKTAPLGDEPPSAGRVTVTVDQIARPGMVVSGKVSFGDGEQGEWGIDQMGRPRLMTSTPGYRPSQGDLMDFQAELEQVLSRMGY